MPSSTQDIPTRLRQAAGDLFAAQGPSGTTVDQIARAAGVNRERVYAYFGGKDGLFARVLADELTAIAEAVPMDVESVADIGAFVGRLYDHHTEHPRLQRLLQWEALVYGPQEVPDELARRKHYQAKVDVLAEAQRQKVLNDEIPPGDLMFLLIAIAAWWSAAPQIVRMTERGSRTTAEAASRRRASAVRAAELLASTSGT